ncbi:DDHD1-like protein [Mya arenaria]|uniref:DDHD1-like protein n=1 Tax=Mya arenaria TaxID=6604 RepID=A0ABY7FAZ3_MYAAR|nr:DDHD1-like protein [Mya arenaria]
MNFSSPGDGINSDLNGESPGYFHERLYPSVDSLINSDSFEEIDSDTNSIAESVASLGTPPRCRKYLYPKKEYVDHLQPEEIRWFYKREGDKKWLPFIGYDSLRIECRYRVQQQNGTDGLSEAEIADLDLILVRGGLYEVDVPNANCKPVYWSGDQYKIMRGTWFYDQTWQPVEEGFATQIETEYLSTFLGHRLDEMSKAPVKGPRPVVLNIRFTDFYIEWNSPVDAFMFSDSASSRLIRAVGHKLGVQKTGSRVHRGYCLEAMMDDKPTDISHLIFVVHGIGQKMDTGHIVRCAQELRDRMHYVTAKLFPNFEHNENRRAEFLPVEWRSSLKLDGDTVESLTPQKMRGIRTMLNASAMDVLYYSSPLYRSEITRSLEAELNRLYKMFCERHPYFEPNGGKVSIVAHSLGRGEGAGWRITRGSVRAGQGKTQVENLFCLGSPLGVFLALRGVRPQAKGTLDHIIPKHISTRLFNIYHPSDPVAYRLEPLVLKHYSTVHPLVIHRYDTADKTPYTQIQSKAFAAFQGSSEVLSEKAETDSVDSASCSTASKESSPTRKRIALNTVGGWFNSITKSMSMDEEGMSAELKMFNRLEKEAEKRDPTPLMANSHDNIDHTDLEYRLDYTLQESGGITRGYISVVTSHTSYWTNRDIACFILTQLHPSLQEKQLP